MSIHASILLCYYVEKGAFGGERKKLNSIAVSQV
jgi:hypothetical protein